MSGLLLLLFFGLPKAHFLNSITNGSKIVDSALKALFKPATVATREEEASCVDVVLCLILNHLAKTVNLFVVLVANFLFSES